MQNKYSTLHNNKDNKQKEVYIRRGNILYLFLLILFSSLDLFKWMDWG